MPARLVFAFVLVLGACAWCGRAAHAIQEATAYAGGGIAEAPQTSSTTAPVSASVQDGYSGQDGSGSGGADASKDRVSAWGKSNSVPENNYSGIAESSYNSSGPWLFDGSTFSPPVSNTLLELTVYAAWSVSGSASFSISIFDKIASYTTLDGYLYNDFDLPSGNGGGKIIELTVPFESVSFVAEPAFYEGIAPFSMSATAYALSGNTTVGTFGSSQAAAYLQVMKFQFRHDETPQPTGPLIAEGGPDYTTPLAAPSARFDGSASAVGGGDFLTWQRGFGNNDALFAQGDATRDGQVDNIDFLIWKVQFGALPPGAAAAIPEPHAAALAAVGCVAVGAKRFRRRPPPAAGV